MPFDQSNLNIGHERLRMLSIALRRELPLVWQYSTVMATDSPIARVASRGRCNTLGCALGLACLLWKNYSPGEIVNDPTFFSMSERDFDNIFYLLDIYLGKSKAEVTPLDVADAIDGYLKTGKFDACNGIAIQLSAHVHA